MKIMYFVFFGEAIALRIVSGGAERYSELIK
jgi:hypothetical protein